MTSSSKLAMSSEFLTAYALLPKSQQKKTRALIAKFQQGVEAKGLNYERVQGADRGIRSLRIDKAYRAIVFEPQTGDVHLLLWAANHDDAYKWAESHHCSINPDTGALQVYQPSAPPSTDARTPVASPAQAHAPAGAFHALRDRELRRLGAPDPMIAELRQVQGEDDLDLLKERIPVDVYEALFMFLAGDSYEDLIRKRETPAAEIDTNDYAAALRRIDSQARFVVVDDQVELEAVLNAPLEKWRVFLHPTQRRLVERRWNGPVRVLGGAGTGKTVVAIHRARWLARNLPGKDRILFVTFTRNLAADIENNLRSICSPEELARIEVTNLDRWVYAFLRRHRYDFRIVYDREKEKTWQDALARKDPGLGLPDAFYREELEQVVLPAGVTTEAEYLRVPRTGRGTPLHRAARARVWPVFEESSAQRQSR